MQRIEANMDNGHPLPVMVYTADSLADMLESRNTVITDTQSMIDSRGRYIQSLHRFSTLADRGIAKMRGLPYTIPSNAIIALPHVRHNEDFTPSRATEIYDQTADHTVLLPNFFYEKFLRTLGANIYASVAKQENWAGSVILFNQYRTNTSDASFLVHIGNRYVRDKRVAELEELAVQIASKVTGLSR